MVCLSELEQSISRYFKLHTSFRYNVRSTFIFDARKDYPNISDLVLKKPINIQTNLNISESIELDTADSIFKRSFINVSLTDLDTDGGKIESVELAYNEQSASNDEYEVITKFHENNLDHIRNINNMLHLFYEKKR